MLNRFKKTVKKLNNTGAYINMPKSEIDKEYYVLTLEELRLITNNKEIK